MIFGYVLTSSEHYPELCIVSDKPSPYTKPTPIRLFKETKEAVHLLSNEEGILIRNEENALIIENIKPAKLYLTPNLPEKPGFSVNKIKIVAKSEDQNEVFFQRTERGWEPWTPNDKLY